MQCLSYAPSNEGVKLVDGIKTATNSSDVHEIAHSYANASASLPCHACLVFKFITNTFDQLLISKMQSNVSTKTWPWFAMTSDVEVVKNPTAFNFVNMHMSFLLLASLKVSCANLECELKITRVFTKARSIQKRNENKNFTFILNYVSVFDCYTMYYRPAINW